MFELITASEWFQSTSIILFLNKLDQFREKVARLPISSYFETFTEPCGPGNVAYRAELEKAGCQFFRGLFLDIASSLGKDVVCAM